MNTGQGDPGAMAQAAYGDTQRLERRVAALEHREQRQQWLDTYNAALTGMCAADDGSCLMEQLHIAATAMANRLHGEQS